MADTNGLRKDFSQNTSKEGIFSGAGGFSRFGPTVEVTPGTILAAKNKENSEKTPLHESITARGGVFGTDTFTAKAPVRIIHRVGREVGGTPISPEELAELKRTQAILKQAQANGLILDLDTTGGLTIETEGVIEETLQKEASERTKKETLLTAFEYLKKSGSVLIGKNELNEQERKKLSDLIDSIEELVGNTTANPFPLEGLEKKITLLKKSVETLGETFETLLAEARSQDKEKTNILEESIDIGISLGTLSTTVSNLKNEELTKEYEELTLLFASLKRNPTPETLALIKTKLTTFQNNVDTKLVAHVKSKEKEQVAVTQDTEAVAQAVISAPQPETSKEEVPAQPLYTNRYEQSDVPEFAAIKFKAWPDEQMRKVVTQGTISWKHFNKAGALLEEIDGEDALFWETLKGNLGSIRTLCEKFLNTGDVEARKKNREFSSEIGEMYENLLIAIRTAERQEASQALQTLTAKLEELKSEKKAGTEVKESAGTFDDLKKMQKNEILTARFSDDIKRHEEIIARYKKLFQYLKSDYTIGEFERMFINLKELRRLLEEPQGLDESLLSTYEKYLTDIDKEETGFLAMASKTAINEYGTGIISQLTHSTITPDKPEKLVPIRGKNARASLLNLEAQQLENRIQYINKLTPSNKQTSEAKPILNDSVQENTLAKESEKQAESRAKFINELVGAAKTNASPLVLNEGVRAEVESEKIGLREARGGVLRRSISTSLGLPQRPSSSAQTRTESAANLDTDIVIDDREPVIMGGARTEPSMEVIPKQEEILAETAPLHVESAPQEMTPDQRQEVAKKVTKTIDVLIAALKDKPRLYIIGILAGLAVGFAQGKEIKGRTETVQARTLEQAVSWRDELTQKQSEFSHDLVGRNSLPFDVFMQKYAHSVNIKNTSRRGDLLTLQVDDLLHSQSLNFPVQEREELCNIIKQLEELIKLSQAASFKGRNETFMDLYNRACNAVTAGDTSEGKQL